MKKHSGYKMLSIVLTIVLLFTLIGGTAVMFKRESGDTISGSFTPGNDNNKNDSPSVVDYSELTYVALGDSITYGLRVETPYPEIVGDMLGLKAVYNYGISASTLTTAITTQNPFVERYTNMVNYADIVSVMGGINDYMNAKADLGTIDSTDTTTIYGALNVLCEGLKEKYPRTYIFFMTPYKYREDQGVNVKGYSLLDVVTAIKEVCGKYNIDVLDMYTYGQFEDIEMNNLSGDGLHPSQDFYVNYTAPQIVEFIKSNYK